MPYNPAFSDDEFIKIWNELGSPTLVAQKIKMNPRSVMARRKSIELRLGIELPGA